MTNEEAIGFGNMWLEINEDVKDSSTYTFFQMAIEALEQQKEYISKMDEVRRAYDNISKVELCEDCISRQAVLDAVLLVPIAPLIKGDNVHYERVVYENVIKDLPSVTPAPKMGRWIPVSERLPYEDGDYLTTYIWEKYPEYDTKIDEWRRGEWVETSRNCRVIAWMPLPPCYEPQESEDNK